VLGSAQPWEVADADACARAGVEIVRRRSGGGAVLLDPGAVLWVDLLIPRDDPLWDDDVGRASHWVGATWAKALTALGVDAVVHTGALVRTAWSPLVCFAGLGPGELVVGDRKVLGVSQRRSRHAARFQCALLGSWDPGRLLGLLPLAEAERADAATALAGVAGPAGVQLADAADVLLDALP
jgi:lipoate-protein ligase A